MQSVQQTASHPTWWPCTPPSKTQDYFNPRQAVWMRSTFPLNPGRQDLQAYYNYNVDTSKYYNFSILTESGARIQKNVYMDGEWQAIIMDAVTVKGVELWPKEVIVDNDGNVSFKTIKDSIKFRDIDGAPHYTSYYFYEYTIHFEDIYEREKEVIYTFSESGGGNTVYVHTYVKRPTYTLWTSTFNYTNDTILYRQENIIRTGTEINECPTDTFIIGWMRNGGGLNDDVLFTASIIEGAEYGELYNSSRNKAGTSLTLPYWEIKEGLFFVTEYSENPTTDQQITIEISCNDVDVSPHSVTTSFIVIHNPNPPPGIHIDFERNPISHGEITGILIKERTVNGEVIDFPNDQRFNIFVYDGEDFGELYSEEWEYYDISFWDVAGGLKYRANSEIEEDSVKIIIYVETAGEGSIASRLAPSANNIIKESNSLQKTNSNNFLYGYGELIILNKNVAYVKAFFENEILIPGDTVNVIVKKVDGEGTETDFPPNTLFEVGIKEGCDVGNILTIDGQLGQYFKDINGPIRFVVNDSLEVDSTNIVLRVGVPPSEDEIYLPYSAFVQKQLPLNLTSEISLSKVGGVQKVTDQTTEYCILNTFEYSGHAFAVGEVENINIDLTLTGEKSIWPNLINYKKPAGYNPITNVKVEVKRGNTILANQNVELTLKRIEGTGGHNHIDPPLPLSKCGEIKYMGIKDNPIIAVTDQNGEIVTDEILSSQFGGMYYIEAKLKSKPSIKDTIQFFVKVPNLVSLPSSNYYNKIGDVPNHMDNHWGTQELVNKVLKLSQEWQKNNFTNVKILSINDMSLPYGGLFDCDEKPDKIWNIPHKTHRIGDCVDIQSRLMIGERFFDANRNGWYDPDKDTLYDENDNGIFEPGQLRVFRNIALDRAGFSTVNYETQPVTKSPHWHLIK